MKYREAKNIIKKSGQTPLDIKRTASKKSGFMVSFEEVKGSMLHSGHFPSKHGKERLIKNEEDAWLLCYQFATATKDRMVNLYVIDHTFSPVKNYSARKIKNR